MRRIDLPLTRIIATLGPASADEGVIRRMIDGGVSVFRLNFSHGDKQDHLGALRLVRRAADALQRPIAVLGDLPGPKIRVGPLREGGVEVQAGDEVVFTRIDQVGGPGESGPPFTFSVSFPRMIDDVQVGERVLINDGAVRLLVVDKGPDAAVCRVTVGGLITSRKGINLPDTDLKIDALTPHDRACVAFAVENDIDFLGMSFVRSGDEIESLRALVRTMSDRGPSIVAKIEQPRAVKNFDAILDAADAIMVARGDLGVEMDLARVPVIQKQLVRRAQEFGRPCIVATQMLESMIHASAPTRAEMSDVAGAIFDGVDAVMLSGETAVGKHPALAVEYVRQVAIQTEAWIAEQPPRDSAPRQLREARNRTAALAHGVWTIVHDFDVRVVVVWSQRGGGARMLSQNDLHVPIIAISSDHSTLRRMQLLRSVVPVHMHPPGTLSEWTRQIDVFLVENGWAQPGEKCVLMAGSPLEQIANTNAIAIHEVGNADTGFSRFDALLAHTTPV